MKPQHRRPESASIRVIRARILLLVAATALLVMLQPTPGLAHEGHDHGGEAKPAAMPQLAPRFAVASDLFELVGVAGADGLTLYLDRFADNRPVAGAKIEIDGPLKGVAAEIAPAVYRLPSPLLAPGKHELTLTIVAGEDSDLLAASLRIEAPVPASAAAAGGIDRRTLGLAALLSLVIAGTGWQAWRRRAA